MAWVIARTNRREWQACFYLRKAGLRCFWPVEHHYFIDKKTKKERFTIRARFAGYVFVEIASDDERALASEAIGVASLLGWWTEQGYKLATVPDHFVTDLMDAGPEVFNKQGTKGRAKFKPGQKVTLAVNAITEILAEFARLDDKGKAVVLVEALGKACETHVDQDRLQAAE